MPQAPDRHFLPHTRRRLLKESEQVNSREDLLADFLGDERASSVLADLHPQPRPVGMFVDSLLKQVHPEELDLRQQLERQWPALVGEVNARQCRPLTIRGTTLVIEVFQQMFLYLLRTEQRNIIQQRVSDYTGGRIAAVEFTPAGRFGRRFPKNEKKP